MSETLPDYWMSEITASVNTVLSNISNIKNSSDYTPRTSTFFFITDTHWRGNAKRSPEIALQTANAIDLAIDNDANISSIFKTTNANGYRRVIFAGDMIKGNAGTKEAAYEEGNDFLSAWDNSFHIAVALGNHDTNREGNTSENILSTNEMHDSFLARESSYVTRDYLNKDVEIGYWDDTVNKIRFFMFRHYGYSDLSSNVWNKFNEYLEDIINAGWGAIFFCHAFWNLTEDTLNPEHMQKPSGSITFASKLADICSSKGIIPIALMVGHIHADDSYSLITENHNKILITSTVCDTYIGEATRIPSPSMTLGNSTEQAFEIVQVDMNYGKLYLTRVGAGFDRIFDIPAMHSSLVPVINPEIYNEGYNIMSVKFINLENLSDFWNNAKNYIDDNDNTNRQEIEDQLYNWQKTEKAPMVQCEPVPNSELHPVINFSFTETSPVLGDKSPENPSTITGVDSIAVTRCGKNLITFPYFSSSGTVSGVTFTVNSDGSFTLDGTNTSNSSVEWYCIRYGAGYKKRLPAGTYTCSAGNTNGSWETYYIRFEFTDLVTGLGTSFYNYNGASKTFTFTNPQYLWIQIIVRAGQTVSNQTFTPQLELASSASSYELFEGADYTVNLNGTYYGGSIDLATGLMTVTHCAFRIGDYESVATYNSDENRWQIFVQPRADYLVNPVCTHSIFDSGSIFSNATDGYCRWAAGGSGTWWWFRSTATTISDFMDIYADAYVAYKLYEPQIVQLTSQQIKSISSLEGTSKRINTIYTDADSVQVEYQKYVGIDSTLDNDSVNAIQNKTVNSALNTKVSLSGDETINGTKTFSNTINGNITGDASTVAGHIVSKDVPVNAAFTDTTYDPATQSTAGLMSASDKIKLDAVGSVFTFKGSVIDDTYLPASDNVSGDAYLAEDTGHVHVYAGTSFVDIGVWAGIPSATDAQIDALFED